jgi:hypothetical protein
MPLLCNLWVTVGPVLVTCHFFIVLVRMLLSTYPPKTYLTHYIKVGSVGNSKCSRTKCTGLHL